MRWSLSFSVLLISAVGGAWAQPQPQRVSGRVVDHAGGPVANSRIRAVPLTAAASGVVATPAGRGANALGAPDGSFALTGLAAGLYQLCADAPGRELLDPCLWDRLPTPVAVGELPLTGAAVHLKRGATLSIRVDDPAKALAVAEKSGKGHLLVGVWSANGLFHPARVTAEDAAGRTYSLEMPVGVTAKLSVTPSALRVQDTTGKALTAGAAVDVNMLPAGQALRYTVMP